MEAIHHTLLALESPAIGGIFVYDEYEGAENLNAAKEALLIHLQKMERCGVELFIDGKAVASAEIVAKTVRENSPYMADYVLDEVGVISQVRFDRVTKR